MLCAAEGARPISRGLLVQPNTVYHGNGFIGGIIMMHLTRMRGGVRLSGEVSCEYEGATDWREIGNWESVWQNSFQEFLRSKPAGWYPQLNDQDVFNAVFTRAPYTSLIRTIPCEWNLQYHAYLAQLRHCADARLNCPKLLEQGIFVCPRPPAVVHFMVLQFAQSFTRTLQMFQSFAAACACLFAGAIVSQSEPIVLHRVLGCCLAHAPQPSGVRHALKSGPVRLFGSRGPFIQPSWAACYLANRRPGARYAAGP